MEERGIPFEIYDHQPITSVEESKQLGLPHEGAGTKNFFLRDKKKRNYCFKHSLKNQNSTVLIVQVADKHVMKTSTNMSLVVPLTLKVDKTIARKNVWHFYSLKSKDKD